MLHQYIFVFNKNVFRLKRDYTITNKLINIIKLWTKLLKTLKSLKRSLILFCDSLFRIEGLQIV